MSFPAIVLLASALVFAGFGVLSLVAPGRMAALVDFGAPGATARVELRAMYGGLELGIAAALTWAAFTPSLHPFALAATLCMIAGIGGGRLLGLLLDRGARRAMWIAFTIEAAGAGAAALALVRLPDPAVPAPTTEVPMTATRATPVMIVDRIEPVLGFWVDRLGWTKTIEVPDTARGGLGFVAVEQAGVQLMFQTWHSVLEDAGPSVYPSQPQDHTPLFIEVSDLADVQRRLGGEGVLVAERTTFYGARETIVRTGYGQVVTFAQFAREGE